MKRNSIAKLIVLACAVIITSSCSKSTTPNGGTPPPPPPPDAIKDSYCGGVITGGGTFLTGKTYNITCGNIIANGGTLTFQPGAILKFGGTPQIITLGYKHSHNDLNINMTQIQANFEKRGANRLEATSAAAAAPSFKVYSIYLTGGASINIQGTKAQHVVFQPAVANPVWPNGYWGGINCDATTKSVNVQWADISYTGGSDSIAKNQYAFFVDGPTLAGSTAIPVTLENSSFAYGVDDVTRFQGNLLVSIKGNTFRKEGSNDGDGVNIKSGVHGDVAYNYCWSGANNSIKLNASLTNLTAVTNVNVYNNTIINGGWRKVGEVSSGILVDAHAQGTVYNNLIVNCRNGLRITAASDTLYTKGKFDYNYIYAVQDSTAALAYGPKEWGKPGPHDIYSRKGGDKNPLLKAFDPTTLGPASLLDKNDPHLQAGSPAIGAGWTGAKYTSGLGTTAGFLPGKDIGAFQNDGTGNQRSN